MGCTLPCLVVLLLLVALPPTHSTKFVANPAARLSREHRALVEQLWKVRLGLAAAAARLRFPPELREQTPLLYRSSQPPAIAPAVAPAPQMQPNLAISETVIRQGQKHEVDGRNWARLAHKIATAGSTGSSIKIVTFGGSVSVGYRCAGRRLPSKHSARSVSSCHSTRPLGGPGSACWVACGGGPCCDCLMCV